MLVEDAGDIDDFCLPVFKIVLVGPSGAGKSSLMKQYFDKTFEHNSTRTTVGLDFKQKLMSIHGNHCKVLIFDTAGQERLRALTRSYYRSAQAVILLYDISRKETFEQDMESWFAEVEEKAPETAVVCLTAGKSDMFCSALWNTEIDTSNTRDTSANATDSPATSPDSTAKKDPKRTVTEVTPGLKIRTETKERTGTETGTGPAVENTSPTFTSSIMKPSSPAPHFVTEEEGRKMAEKHNALFSTTSAATGEGVRDVFVRVIDEYVQKWGLPDPPRHTRKLVYAKSEVERKRGWCC